MPIVGAYDDVKEINFDNMPDRFVMKTTNGSHTNLFCENKEEFDFEEAKNKLEIWLNIDVISPGREWAYHGIKPKIICETFINKDENNDLIDYKFFCFNGEVYCIYIVIERFLESGIKPGIYDKILIKCLIEYRSYRKRN